MIHEGLMFGEIFEYEPVTSCVSMMSLIKPVLHLVFIFIQLYFIFLNSKVTERLMDSKVNVRVYTNIEILKRSFRL